MNTDVESYIAKNAPDIKAIPSSIDLNKSPEDYNLEICGKEHIEVMHNMVEIILNWLSYPLIEDEAENDSERIKREDKAPKEVKQFLKNHKSHPEALNNTVIALEVLLQYTEKVGVCIFNGGNRERIQTVVANYRIFKTLRNHLKDTKTMIWKEIGPLFTSKEEDALQDSPHKMINKKIARLIKKLEAITLEMLQRMEKKG